MGTKMNNPIKDTTIELAKLQAINEIGAEMINIFYEKIGKEDRTKEEFSLYKEMLDMVNGKWDTMYKEIKF